MDTQPATKIAAERERSPARRAQANVNRKARVTKRRRAESGDGLLRIPPATKGGDGAGSEAIDLYLDELRRQRLLTAEEEVELAQAIEAGRLAVARLKKGNVDAETRARLERQVEAGVAAREHLIQSNMRLVISIAKRYRNRGLSFLDLIQEGNVGLIIATDKFDYTMGNRFSTYATWWIRQSITRALANQSRTIRLPAHWHSVLIKMNRLLRQWEQRYETPPTAEELAAELEITPEQVKWLKQASQAPLPLEQPSGPDGDTELGDFIEDEDSPDPALVTQQTLMAEQLTTLLDELPAREAQILRLRYGLQDGRARSFREIGELFGLSRERIRQLEHDALTKLRFASTQPASSVRLG